MTNPHLAQPFAYAGASLDKASRAALMVHGRGGTPQAMLSLISLIDVADVAYVLPSAAQHSWYPARFIEPVDINEPYLSYALETCDVALSTISDYGIGPESTFLIGFSQGACLLAEFAVRNPRRYAGIALLTGGYLGPLDQPRQPSGSFEGTPTFLGSSRYDAWVPHSRVVHTADLFRAMNADVTLEIYDDREHHVNEAAVVATRTLILDS